MKVDEQYLDVLQNIESAIISVYDENSTLLDLDVQEALDGLIRTYTWEDDNRGVPTLRLSTRAQLVYNGVHHMCDWRLGRQSLDPSLFSRQNSSLKAITLPEILACLKHIRQSVRFWNKENGRQGYLTYVRQFFNNIF